MGHWFRLGDMELLVVSDGLIWQDAGATFGLVPRIMWERYVPEIDEKHRLAVGLNSLVVRAAGRTVLIDSGCGTKSIRAPGAMGIDNTGRLIGNLAAEGIRPGDIDVVLNTHLHFDHCGGNTIVEDARPGPAFPRAKYILQKGEWDAASHPNERTRGTYLAENFEPLEDSRQVELVHGDAEVVPGLRMTMAPGHTDDHVVFEIESGGDVAIYIGELAQNPVQLERVAWVSAFDILPMVSIETKKRFIEKAVDRRALLISVHAEYPGLGRLRAEDGKRKWEADTSSGANA
jgi:glyoxylase-like metal-dependent hydrolase (beta-lactamase superfamily II)